MAIAAEKTEKKWNLDEAEKCYDEALKLAKQVGDVGFREILAWAYPWLGKIYRDRKNEIKKDSTSAGYCFKKAKDLGIPKRC